MKEIYKNILGMIDLTSLNATDTPASVRAIVDKVNNFNNVFPDLSQAASICFYPILPGLIAAHVEAGIFVLQLSEALFRASQSPLKV